MEKIQQFQQRNTSKFINRRRLPIDETKNFRKKKQDLEKEKEK